MTLNFPFVGPTYQARSLTFDAQRTVNLYPSLDESGSSAAVAALYGTPGLKPWATLPTANVRGLLRFSASQAIAVAGTAVYSLNTAGGFTALSGAVDGLSTPVSMASNGSVIMCVTGPNGYFINPSAGTVTPITDPDFYGATHVAFIDGYFVWNRPGTGKFQWSQLYGTNIDALDFATAEGAPDNLVALAVDHREVWLFGENTTEVWYNAGDEFLPFARIQGAFLEIGCAAPYSVAKFDNSLVWLAADDRGRGTVQRADGYSPKRISTDAVEYAISKYSTIADARAFTYSQEGHLFYVLTFPAGNATWVYDAATQMWHERAHRSADGALNRIRPNAQMAFAGKVIVGDWQSGKLWEYDMDTYSDDGAVIPRIRTAPHLVEGRRMVSYDSLEIVMETGVGLASGPGSDPQAMLQWSNDGGFNWSNEYWRPIGKIGERRRRVRFDRLGAARDRVFRLTITDPVKVAIVGAELRARVHGS